jgi:hypothetical protein
MRTANAPTSALAVISFTVLRDDCARQAIVASPKSAVLVAEFLLNGRR